MQHDRVITIATGASRRATQWVTQQLLLSEFYTRLSIPVRSAEPLNEYLSLTKAQQDELKDVGGFVGGALSGMRRKANAIEGRDLVTLDLDNIPPGQKDEVIRRVSGLGCGYCIYSTRKHQPAAPRLRVILPLDRSVTAEEYEPIARRLAERIGMEYTDPTTFEPARLMYWPSCSADSEYVYLVSGGAFVSADGILATYLNWRDITSWPALPGQANFTKLAVKQGDPESKQGVVGAFCRLYSITRAMEELLPGIYQPVEAMPGRYTYVDGSTAGGAVLYDDDKFLYSHHATDPCSGKLVNAFDLVRLHKFAEADDEAAQGTPGNRLPSYQAMCSYAVSLPDVVAMINQERMQRAVADFEGVAAEQGAVEDDNWLSLLEVNTQTGVPKSTIDNVRIVLEHDTLLKGKFALNEFAGRGEVLGELPWDRRAKRRLWDDNDNMGLYWYMEHCYKITGNGKIDGALSLHSNAHAFNEVRDYLLGLRGRWDGVHRLDSLFIDYLGAEDSGYNRAVTRKSFVAAVARALQPGCKYDNMVILAGAQGLGKSTLLYKMSKGWFSDSLRTFEGKEASELLQGVWLVEVSELDAFRRTDVSRIKQFLSLRADRFRAAYGRHVKEIPRSCVFFGTTNMSEYLQDRTGNRRFWPVDVGVKKPIKNVFHQLDQEVDQLWAEAVMYWQAGETLYLTGELEEQAKAKQEEHREVDEREGLIADFVEKEVPEDWSKWPLERRRMYWSGGINGTETIRTVPRDRVCAMEIWCEVLGGHPRDLRNLDSRIINSIISSMPGWKMSRTAMRFGPYGVKRGFTKGHLSDVTI